VEGFPLGSAAKVVKGTKCSSLAMKDESEKKIKEEREQDGSSSPSPFSFSSFSSSSSSSSSCFSHVEMFLPYIVWDMQKRTLLFHPDGLVDLPKISPESSSPRSSSFSSSLCVYPPERSSAYVELPDDLEDSGLTSVVEREGEQLVAVHSNMELLLFDEMNTFEKEMNEATQIPAIFCECEGNFGEMKVPEDDDQFLYGTGEYAQRVDEYVDEVLLLLLDGVLKFCGTEYGLGEVDEED
jgi:hypothetical protein